MFDKLQRILAMVDAEYADIRYEIKDETVVSLNKRELSQVGVNRGDGFVIRILKNGGFAGVSFTKLEDAEKAVRLASANASILGKNRAKPIKLAELEAVKDKVIPELKEDPREISLDEKIELLKGYNEIPLKEEKIVNTNFGLTEVVREKYFASTSGHEIREDLITIQLRGMITSKDGAIIQNVRVGSGGSDGFHSVRNIEHLFEDKTKIVLDLLKAKPINGGVHDIITDPQLAGVFVHEAFGHFSEADIIESLPEMRRKMQLNEKLGNDVLSIVDDATIKNQLGKYKYDDEGVPVRRVQLVKNGVLTGRLHSRRTAAEFAEPLTGHTVAEDYRFSPIVRMGNIFIEPGDKSFDEMLAELGNGYYISGSKGGQTAGENFTFGAQYGYEVKNGKLGDMVREINISGNLYKTLMNITAVGDSLLLSKIGGCGKGQMNIRSTNGGPHTLIRNLIIGGA